LIQCRYSGRKKLIRINNKNLYHPDDPFLRIPQIEYQDKIRIIVKEILSTINRVEAVILFGSFARGKADRMSDVDILVIVKGSKRPEHNAALVENKAASGKLLDERYRVNIIIEELDELSKALVKNAALQTALGQGIVLRGSKRFDRAIENIDL
jgi:predicted nucleotidyltransferase